MASGDSVTLTPTRSELARRRRWQEIVLRPGHARTGALAGPWSNRHGEQVVVLAVRAGAAVADLAYDDVLGTREELTARDFGTDAHPWLSAIALNRRLLKRRMRSTRAKPSRAPFSVDAPLGELQHKRFAGTAPEELQPIRSGGLRLARRTARAGPEGRQPH